jgi:ubiquinone/menaquinone biosynthesis C-methylase UbiE
MTSVIGKIKLRIREEQFNPSWLGLFCNESYIIRRKLLEVIRREATHFGGKLLDFGCGSKPYEDLFSHSTNYIGLDLEVSGHSGEYKRADVFYDGTNLPFGNNTFDSVIAIEVLEHIPNVEQILVELNRVLKPQGKILITTPFMYPEHEEPYDFHRFTTDGHKVLLRDNWSIIHIEKLNDSHDVIFQLLLRNQILAIKNVSSIVGKLRRILFISVINVFWLITKRLFSSNSKSYTNTLVIAEKSKAAVTVKGNLTK